MTNQVRAWKPLAEATTQNVAVTAVSAFINLATLTPGYCAIRVALVGGTAPAFIELVEAAGTPAVATTSFPILPNTVEIFTFANDEVGVAVIGTDGVLYVTPGEGM